MRAIVDRFDLNKFAVRWALNDYSIWYNGTKQEQLVNKYIAFGITVGSAFIKEVLYDGLLKKGNVEFGDFAAGSAIAILDLITNDQ